MLVALFAFIAIVVATAFAAYRFYTRDQYLRKDTSWYVVSYALPAVVIAASVTALVALYAMQQAPASGTALDYEDIEGDTLIGIAGSPSGTTTSTTFTPKSPGSMTFARTSGRRTSSHHSVSTPPPSITKQRTRIPARSNRGACKARTYARRNEESYLKNPQNSYAKKRYENSLLNLQRAMEGAWQHKTDVQTVRAFYETGNMEGFPPCPVETGA